MDLRAVLVCLHVWTREVDCMAEDRLRTPNTAVITWEGLLCSEQFCAGRSVESESGAEDR